MKRIELFEFEDFPGFPKVFRTGVTNLIRVFHRWTGTPTIIANLIQDTLGRHSFQQIVDLGSGSGGPLPEAMAELDSDFSQPLQILLTDLHPHPDVVHRYNQGESDHIRYHSEPVDATSIGDTPEGLKTMIGSFHHMRPDMARRILHSARDNGQPILIYELAKNTIPLLLWWLLLPLSLSILFVMSWVMTPFVRPLTFSQLFFTYIIPVIPLVYAWDGQASLVRTYTFDDIRELLGETDSENYQWTIEDAVNEKGNKQGYFIRGLPG